MFCSRLLRRKGGGEDGTNRLPMLPSGRDIVLQEIRLRSLVGGLLRLVMSIDGSLHRFWLRMRYPFVPFRDLHSCLPLFGQRKVRISEGLTM